MGKREGGGGRGEMGGGNSALSATFSSGKLEGNT